MSLHKFNSEPSKTYGWLNIQQRPQPETPETPETAQERAQLIADERQEENQQRTTTTDSRELWIVDYGTWASCAFSQQEAIGKMGTGGLTTRIYRVREVLTNEGQREEDGLVIRKLHTQADEIQQLREQLVLLREEHRQAAAYLCDEIQKGNGLREQLVEKTESIKRVLARSGCDSGGLDEMVENYERQLAFFYRFFS